jgi:hypothetical protein
MKPFSPLIGVWPKVYVKSSVKLRGTSAYNLYFDSLTWIRSDISDFLSKNENTMDVKVMLQALQQTTDFEIKLNGRFTVRVTMTTASSVS